MLLPFVNRRSPRRRVVSPRWARWRRWRALARTRAVRWSVAAMPVLTMLTVAAPRGLDLTQTWAFVGRIGVAVATVMIGWVVLKSGRWL